MVFDKSKPDLDFFRKRCSQSAAFRQLLYTSDAVGGRCSPTRTLPYGTLENPPCMRRGGTTLKGQGATLDVVAKAAADAAFEHDPLFSLPNSSPMSSAFPLVTSEARPIRTPHLQIPNQSKKRIRNLAGAKMNLGHGVKRTRLEEPAQRQCPPPSSKIARLAGSLSGQQLDSFGTKQARGAIISTAVLERGDCGFPALSSVGKIGDIPCDEALNNSDGVQEHILQASGGVSNRKPKRRLRSATPAPSPKCRLAGSVPTIRVPSENISFPAHTQILQDPADGTTVQKSLDQGGEAGRTRWAVCQSPTAGREHDSGNGAHESTREARQTVCNPVYHAASLHSERNKHDFSGAAGICKSSNSTSASVASRQLLCGLGISRKSSSALREPAEGLLGNADDRWIDSKSFLHSSGGSASTDQRQSVWREISAHDGAVTCLVPSPDGTYLVSSGSDGRIRLWNALSGSHCFVHMILNIPSNSALTSVQEPRRSRTSAIPAGPEKSKTLTSNRSASMWGVQAAMSKSGEYLLHGMGRVLCTFDIMSGAELHITAPGHRDDIVCVAWNDEKNEAYSGALDGSILICDAISGYTSEDAEDADGEEVPVVNVSPLGSL